MENSGVYIIINTASHGIYIGSTSNFTRRWRQHKNLLIKNKHKNPHLQNSYNKYGPDVFIYEILEIAPVNNLTEAEQQWFDTLRFMGCELYNLRLIQQSNVGIKLLIETKLKMSLSHTGKSLSESHKEKIGISQIGRKHPTSVIEKIKASRKVGIPLSESHRAKISLSIKGKLKSEETKIKMSSAFIGRHHSSEAKEKMRLAKIGKSLSKETKQKMVNSQKIRRERERQGGI